LYFIVYFLYFFDTLKQMINPPMRNWRFGALRRFKTSRRGAASQRGSGKRGFALFDGKVGFAAVLGRFGETTLPFFR
jgi:hypothetical protein